MCAYHRTSNGLVVEVVSRGLRRVLLPEERAWNTVPSGERFYQQLLDDERRPVAREPARHVGRVHRADRASRRRGTSTRRSTGARSSGSGAACGRWRAARSRSPRSATRSSTRSPTGRSSSCAPRRTRSGRSTTRACTAGRSCAPARAASPRGSAAPTTGSPGTSTARLREIPCGWDFPHVDPAEFCLPEAQVATWGGFVFVNVDLARRVRSPTTSRTCRGTSRDVAARGPLPHARTSCASMPCNWKVALEAFIEAYHTDGRAPAAAHDVRRHADRVRRLRAARQPHDHRRRHQQRAPRSRGRRRRDRARDARRRRRRGRRSTRVDGTADARQTSRGSRWPKRTGRDLLGRHRRRAARRRSSTSSSPTSCRGPGSSPRSPTASAPTATTPTPA